MTGTVAVRLGTVGLALALATGAAAAPARRMVTKKTTASTKLSAAQIYQKFDSLEEQLKKLTLAVEGGPKSPAPVVVMPNAREGIASKDMTQAFYNYGVYSRQAAGSHMAARAIRLVTLVAGGSLAIHGWTDSFDKLAPRTFNNAFHDYPAFSYGVTTLLLGQLIAVIMDVRGDVADMSAARALMKPLEDQSSGTALAPASPVPATLAPASAAP